MSRLKNNFRELYTPHESFVMRNPLFPAELFFGWKPGVGKNELPGNALRETLRSFYRQPLAQEALYIASPDLHARLLLWLDNKIDKPDKQEKTELSLAKYMIRMGTRCTPYGLFASCSTGVLAGNTSITLADTDHLLRKGRLDMDYVCEVHAHLLQQKELCNQLTFYPNSSLYEMGGQLRYIEHRFTEKEGRSYHLVQVESSDYLQNILDKALHGATPAALAATIAGGDISTEEALEFIHELIHNQVLVSGLEPSVTGEEYFHRLMQKMCSLSGAEKYISALEKIARDFLELSSGKTGHMYAGIAKTLQALEIPVHLKTLIQVDSFRPASCTLNAQVADELLLGATLLHRLSVLPARDAFDEFRNAFRHRYESQYIPLVEVLDTESGIGYGKFVTSGMEESPLIDRLPFGNGANPVPALPDAEAWKWKLFQEALAGKKNEVVLDENDISELLSKELTPGKLPDSICMMARIHAASSDDIDAGRYALSLNAPTGPSGANLLARFCHLDSNIDELSREVLRAEEAHHPDCIYAEIVHLPESRIGNILMRPRLRTYEIPFLCASTTDPEFRIPVTDLLVGMENETIVLRSRRLNKQVIPRLTTAHNFNLTTLPVYQFLCDLQHQHLHHFGWSWGILESRPFLPRVTFGRFILSKARWLWTREDISPCDKAAAADAGSILCDLARNRNMPLTVLLSQGDNELLLDLENNYCVSLLLNEIRKSGSVVLTESLDLPGLNWVSGPQGHHAAEFLFAFSKKENVLPSPRPASLAKDSGIKRIFPVGSEWLYAKIYCGTKTAEKVLIDVLKPLCEEWLEKSRIEKYFFIRYHDQGHHIRIRFFNRTDPGFWKEIMESLGRHLQPYIDNHTVHNLQYETYQREVERYGEDTMEAGETFFFYQSRAVLEFISLLEGDEGEQYRWQVALKAVDLILDDFGYSMERKRNLVRTLNKNFSEEFRIGAREQKQISERFADRKKLVRFVMNGGTVEDENLEEGLRPFIIDEVGYKKTIEAVLCAPSVLHHPEETDRLLGSYLHMFVNRLFISNQRKVELVLYDYLLKYYESVLALEKNKKQPAEINILAK